MATTPAAGDGGPRDGGRPARRIRHQTHLPISGMYSNTACLSFSVFVCLSLSLFLLCTRHIAYLQVAEMYSMYSILRIEKGFIIIMVYK